VTCEEIPTTSSRAADAAHVWMSFLCTLFVFSCAWSVIPTCTSVIELLGTVYSVSLHVCFSFESFVSSFELIISFLYISNYLRFIEDV